jgi:chromosome segregation ATPase
MVESVDENLSAPANNPHFSRLESKVNGILSSLRAAKTNYEKQESGFERRLGDLENRSQKLLEELQRLETEKETVRKEQIQAKTAFETTISGIEGALTHADCINVRHIQRGLFLRLYPLEYSKLIYNLSRLTMRLPNLI